MKPCELIGNAILSAFCIVGACFSWWLMFNHWGVSHPVVGAVVGGMLTLLVVYGLSSGCRDKPDTDDTVHLGIGA